MHVSNQCQTVEMINIKVISMTSLYLPWLISGLHFIHAGVRGGGHLLIADVSNQRQLRPIAFMVNTDNT